MTTATSGTGADVRVLRPVDQTAATTLLARGFAEDPGNLVLLPDEDVRRAMIETAAANALRSTLRYGTAHGAFVDGELGGVALWHPPGVPRGSIGTRVQGLAGQLAEAPTLARAVPHATSVIARHVPEAARLLADRRAAVARATGGLCWHLAYLATGPEHRGRGLARALLDRQLRRCDEDAAAVWLETTDPVNPPIYERFGFSTVAHLEEAAWLPGLWVMRREPVDSEAAAT
jgi:GNAT superfamily N-acetyltransferase